MTIKRIHVNRGRIQSNLKHGTSEPVLTVKTSKKNVYGHSVDILGPSRLVNAEMCGLKNLNCGARVYIETTADVVVDGVPV